jgi:hypothetical protein
VRGHVRTLSACGDNRGGHGDDDEDTTVCDVCDVCDIDVIVID